MIVHGHTPSETAMPDLLPNRLNLDTYAFGGKPLIAAVFDERATGPLAFIADDGTVTPAPLIGADEHLEHLTKNRARWR